MCIPSRLPEIYFLWIHIQFQDDTKNELLCLVLVELGVEYLEDAPSSLHYTIAIATLTS